MAAYRRVRHICGGQRWTPAFFATNNRWCLITCRRVLNVTLFYDFHSHRPAPHSAITNIRLAQDARRFAAVSVPAHESAMIQAAVLDAEHSSAAATLRLRVVQVIIFSHLRCRLSPHFKWPNHSYNKLSRALQSHAVTMCLPVEHQLLIRCSRPSRPSC
jgi:hypothetical protein